MRSKRGELRGKGPYKIYYRKRQTAPAQGGLLEHDHQQYHNALQSAVILLMVTRLCRVAMGAFLLLHAPHIVEVLILMSSYAAAAFLYTQLVRPFSSFHVGTDGLTQFAITFAYWFLFFNTVMRALEKLVAVICQSCEK